MPSGDWPRRSAVSASNRIEVRFGVNLGDVIVEGKADTEKGSLFPPASKKAPSRYSYVSEKVARKLEESWHSASSGWVRSTSKYQQARHAL